MWRTGLGGARRLLLCRLLGGLGRRRLPLRLARLVGLGLGFGFGLGLGFGLGFGFGFSGTSIDLPLCGSGRKHTMTPGLTSVAGA